MSIQLAVPFAPLGLDPNVYTGIAIVVDNGIARVGLAKVPYKASYSAQFGDGTLEFVINSSLTTVLSTSGGQLPTNVLKGGVKWLAHPSDVPDPAGLLDPVVIGAFHDYAGQPILPLILVGSVMLAEGARPGDNPPVSQGTPGWAPANLFTLLDDGTTSQTTIQSSSEEFYSPTGLHQTIDSKWLFADSPFGSAQVAGGPLAPTAGAINTGDTGQELVYPIDPVAGLGTRFVGNSEFGLLSSPAGPIRAQTNAYRNSDGTFTCYEEVYDGDSDLTQVAANIYTRSGDTYNLTGQIGITANSVKALIDAAGIQYDPAQPTAWDSHVVLSGTPPTPQTTVSYFWQNVIEAQETPVITTS